MGQYVSKLQNSLYIRADTISPLFIVPFLAYYLLVCNKATELFMCKWSVPLPRHIKNTLGADTMPPLRGVYYNTGFMCVSHLWQNGGCKSILAQGDGMTAPITLETFQLHFAEEMFSKMASIHILKTQKITRRPCDKSGPQSLLSSDLNNLTIDNECRNVSWNFLF